MLTRALVRQECHHQILQEPAWFREGHVYALCGVTGLLQEDRIAAELAHIDGDVEPLASEDAVHDRDVLMCRVAGPADGDDQDPTLQLVVV